MLEAEEQAKERCLARSVGTNYCNELSSTERKVRIAPYGLVSVTRRQIFRDY
jgi:hypothetical protein